MEKWTPQRALRYAHTMTRRKMRLARRGAAHAINEHKKAFRNGALLATAGVAGVLYVQHTQGEGIFRQRFDWVGIPHGSCVDVGFVALHKVTPGEKASLYIEATSGDGNTQEKQFNVSGDPLSAGWTTICFEQGLIGATVEAHVENTGSIGKSELIYSYPGTHGSE